jgi:8-oxo-dGTP diphosphatase
MAINTDPEIHKQVICANVFIRKDNKYLVMKRSPFKKYLPNYIHPVGGKVDPDENPYITAQREVLEETGLKIKNIRLEALLLELKPEKDKPHNWLIFHFSADYDFGDIIPTEEGELLWLTEEELKRQPLFASVKLVIEHILNKEKGTVFATIEYDGLKEKIINCKIDFCAIA